MKLLLEQITERPVRENFQRLQDEFDKSLLDGFIHIDVTIPAAVTNHKVRHGLGHIPMDFILTRITGDCTLLTLNYENFTAEFIDVTATGPCRFRALIGNYKLSKAVPNGR